MDICIANVVYFEINFWYLAESSDQIKIGIGSEELCFRLIDHVTIGVEFERIQIMQNIITGIN